MVTTWPSRMGGRSPPRARRTLRATHAHAGAGRPQVGVRNHLRKSEFKLSLHGHRKEKENG